MRGLNNATSIIVAATENLGTGWKHLAWTYDGSGLASGVQAYQEGVPVAMSVVRDDLNNNSPGTGLSSIGANFNGTEYQAGTGNLRDVQYYDYELTAADVSALYNNNRVIDANTVTLSGASPYGYWRLISDGLDSGTGGNNATPVNYPGSPFRPFAGPSFVES